MAKIRAAVIGVGYLGKFHAEKYANSPYAELVAVCDAHLETAEKIAQPYGALACNDYKTLLGKVDAVSIAVPTSLHFEVADFFLNNNVHVLVEKPITTTLAEAESLIQSAKKHQLVLQVGHLERFNPAMLALQPILKGPRFIESYRIACFNPRCSDVNVILDLMIHDIDLIQHMIGSPIERIDANGIPVLTKIVDIANARIQFANHSVANVTASRASIKTERKMRIFQSDAYISVDFQNKKFVVHRKGEGEMFPGIPNIHREEFVLEAGDALKDEIEAFLIAVRDQTAPRVSGEEGKRALATALHITEMVTEQLETHLFFAEAETTL